MKSRSIATSFPIAIPVPGARWLPLSQPARSSAVGSAAAYSAKSFQPAMEGFFLASFSRASWRTIGSAAQPFSSNRNRNWKGLRPRTPDRGSEPLTDAPSSCGRGHPPGATSTLGVLTRTDALGRWRRANSSQASSCSGLSLDYDDLGAEQGGCCGRSGIRRHLGAVLKAVGELARVDGVDLRHQALPFRRRRASFRLAKRPTTRLSGPTMTKGLEPLGVGK